MKRHFTLIELLTVMVIGSILLAVATPAIVHAVNEAQVDSAARVVTRACMLARQEAIVQRRRVAILIPETGNAIATCYLQRHADAFDRWTSHQPVVDLPAVGIVTEVVVDDGPTTVPHTTAVSGVAWAPDRPYEVSCRAIIFKPTGAVASSNGMAPIITRVRDAVRTPGGTVAVRSNRGFDVQVDCYTGRWTCTAVPN